MIVDSEGNKIEMLSLSACSNSFNIRQEVKEMQITEIFDGKMCCEEIEQVTGSLERSATKGNFYFSTVNGDMKFCPFCGKEIDKTIKKQIKR